MKKCCHLVDTCTCFFFLISGKFGNFFRERICFEFVGFSSTLNYFSLSCETLISYLCIRWSLCFLETCPRFLIHIHLISRTAIHCLLLPVQIKCSSPFYTQVRSLPLTSLFNSGGLGGLYFPLLPKPTESVTMSCRIYLQDTHKDIDF